MITSEKTEQVLPAYAALLMNLGNPVKDASGAVKGGKALPYLSLPALLEHVARPARECGLGITQELKAHVRTDGIVAGISITTYMIHTSGQWVGIGPSFWPATDDPQARGSVITYGRRYSLQAALGIAAEDDDGESAKLEPGGTVTEQGRAGMGEAEGVGAADYGEGSAAPAPDPYAAHPGIEHKLGPAATPEYRAQGVKVCRIKGCDYVYWPPGTDG